MRRKKRRSAMLRTRWTRRRAQPPFCRNAMSRKRST
jgi:hypothetical protein